MLNFILTIITIQFIGMVSVFVLAALLDDEGIDGKDDEEIFTFMLWAWPVGLLLIFAELLERSFRLTNKCIRKLGDYIPVTSSDVFKAYNSFNRFIRFWDNR